MDNIDIDKVHYLFLPSCQFLGKNPANEVIINGYILQQVNCKNGEIINEKSSSKKIINKIQCCREGIIYDVNIGMNFDEMDIKQLINKDNSLKLIIDVTIKNTRGIENNYFIQSILSYTEENYENNFFI